MNSLRLKLLFVLIVSCGSLFAQQEVIFPLRTNSALKSVSNAQNASGVARASVLNPLDLPFLDDFAPIGLYPDPGRWEGRSAYINSHFARNMLTVGVATFDGMDEFGNPYDNSFSTAQGSCDTLLSYPIDMTPGGTVLDSNSNVILTFFYQKKGYGDAPDLGDSLVLEFFKPDTNGGAWRRQWWVRGPVAFGQDTAFTQVVIRFNTAAYQDYLQDGFRFRFRNHGARTGSLDHWHLDYVKLYQAANPNDTVLSDVAMTLPCSSLLTGFTSVPWNHFSSLTTTAQENLVIDSISMNYRVNGLSSADVGFNNRIYDWQGNQVGAFGATNGNIFPGRPNNLFLSYNAPISGSVFSATAPFPTDSNYFVIKNFFSNGNSFPGLKANDTVTFVQPFFNYYSYDDGSAEGGYDIIGTNTGKLAMQFDLMKPDTLRAVRFYFSQYGDSVTNYLFTLKIWSSINPESVLYQETNKRATYVDSINGFSTYVLAQSLPVSGTVYIGFQQQQNFPNGIHLGFDKNTASNSKMFFNAGSGWANTTVAPGSFMIRPVFGKSDLFVGLSEASSGNGVIVYPNPVRSNLTVRVAEGMEFNTFRMFSIDGRQVMSGTFQPLMDVSGLDDGVYLLLLQTNDGKSSTVRIVVQN